MTLLIGHLDYSKFYALFSPPFSGEKPGFSKLVVSRLSEYEHLLSWQRTVLIKKNRFFIFIAWTINLACLLQ